MNFLLSLKLFSRPQNQRQFSYLSAYSEHIERFSQLHFHSLFSFLQHIQTFTELLSTVFCSASNCFLSFPQFCLSVQLVHTAILNQTVLITQASNYILSHPASTNLLESVHISWAVILPHCAILQTYTLFHYHNTYSDTVFLLLRFLRSTVCGSLLSESCVTTDHFQQPKGWFSHY